MVPGWKHSWLNYMGNVGLLDSRYWSCIIQRNLPLVANLLHFDFPNLDSLMNSKFAFHFLAVVVCHALSSPSALAFGPPHWIHQFGTATNDNAWAIDVDQAGNSAVVSTRSQTHLSLFDAKGNLVWDTMHDEPGRPSLAFGVDFDAAGNIVIAGHMSRRIDDRWSTARDVFVAKYDPNGQHIWTSVDEFGGRTFNSGVSDLEIAPDGSIYVSGYRGGLSFLSRWSPSGQLDWLHSPPQSFGASRTVSVDFFNDDAIYLTGWTEAAMTQPLAGERDIYVARYDANGNQSWLLQRDDHLTDEATDAATDNHGNLYVVGRASERVISNASDSIITKVNEVGEEVWSRQLVDPGIEIASVVETLDSGKVVFGGRTTGGFGSAPRETNQFLGLITPDGTVESLKLLGPTGVSYPHSLAVNEALGSIWIAGSTFEVLGSENFGGQDAYVLRVAIPEPTTMASLVSALALLIGSDSRTRA